MPVAQHKGDKKKCNTLASLIARSTGSCMKCSAVCTCPEFPKHHNKLCKLTSSHIVGRRYAGTFTWIPNLQCLCYSCHRRFTDWPKEFTAWIDQTIGEEAYYELRRRAEQVTKMDWSTELERLTEIARSKGI